MPKNVFEPSTKCQKFILYRGAIYWITSAVLTEDEELLIKSNSIRMKSLLQNCIKLK
jgi:hypothetical protein